MKIAFIGGGNMATAILGGLRAAGSEPASVDVLEIDPAKGAALERDWGVHTHAEAGTWLSAAEIIVLAVKPQDVATAVAAIRPWLGPAVVLSIAAGVRARTLARRIGHERIVRAMPNTPALIRAGITGAIALPAVSAEQRALADTLLKAIGRVVWLDDEALLDPVTAVSGSGPAYVFFFIEALEAAARELGLSAEQAHILAVGTFSGAAQLAAQSPESPSTLRERVTSKGGTTAAALARLEAANVKQAIVEAVRAANARAREMGDEIDRT
jgi:pyrroline-5-carboxylate reductase